MLQEMLILTFIELGTFLTSILLVVTVLILCYSRAGRFGTKGLAISFVSNAGDEEVLKLIQSRFEVAITELPETIDASTYMNA